MRLIDSVNISYGSSSTAFPVIQILDGSANCSNLAGKAAPYFCAYTRNKNLKIYNSKGGLRIIHKVLHFRVLYFSKFEGGGGKNWVLLLKNENRKEIDGFIVSQPKVQDFSSDFYK